VCGRYTLANCEAWDPEEFGVRMPVQALAPRYNLAPTEVAPVVPNRVPRAIDWFRWGLVPGWARDPRIGARLINARAETLAQKPAFRDAFLRRRCLVLADGFYEWHREGRKAVPYLIRRKDRRVFAFAGLWETWRPSGDATPPGPLPLQTFAIVTTQANDLLAPIHDRMPVIVRPTDYDRWLDPAPTSPAALQDLLLPYPSEPLEKFEVAPLVNRAGFDSPACIEPV